MIYIYSTIYHACLPSHTMSMLSGAPTVTVQPSPGQVVLAAGEVITLSCASTGNPRPWITWILNGEQLQVNEPPFSISFPSLDQYSTQSRLTIGPATPNVTGIYHCLAQALNFDGELVVAESNTSQLTFHCKPSLQSDHA